MIVLLPLLRRLSLTARMIVGLALMSAGLVWTGVAGAEAPRLVAHGIVAVVIGGVFLASTRLGTRRDQRAR